jgi:hypothetical protein
MEVQEKWQASWSEHPEAHQIIKRHIELLKTEAVETFELVASTADE